MSVRLWKKVIIFALSYIRANAEELGVDIDFEHTDVHIHIPEGATQKMVHQLV